MRTPRAYASLMFAYLGSKSQGYLSDVWVLWLLSMSYRCLHKGDKPYNYAGERASWLFENRRAWKLLKDIEKDKLVRNIEKDDEFTRY